MDNKGILKKLRKPQQSWQYATYCERRNGIWQVEQDRNKRIMKSRAPPVEGKAPPLQAVEEKVKRHRTPVKGRSHNPLKTMQYEARDGSVDTSVCGI